MSTLKFSDGKTFDTSGSLRQIRRSDGWYVIGDRMLIPVADVEEAQTIIKSLTKKDDEIITKEP